MLLPMAPLHLSGNNAQNEVKHDFVHVMPLALVLAPHGANDIILFLSSRQLKWHATWSCYAIGTGVIVTWCWWHHQWHHSTAYVKWLKWGAAWHLVMCCHWHWYKQHVMIMALSMAQFNLLCQDDWNKMQHDFYGHAMPLALKLVLHDAINIVKGTISFLAPRQSKWGATWLF